MKSEYFFILVHLYIYSSNLQERGANTPTCLRRCQDTAVRLKFLCLFYKDINKILNCFPRPQSGESTVKSVFLKEKEE